MNSKTKPKGSIGKFLEQELYGVPQSKFAKEKDKLLRFAYDYQFILSKEKDKSEKEEDKNQINKPIKNENQINNNKFLIDFEDLVGLSIISKYERYGNGSYDLAIFSVLVFIVEVFVSASVFSFWFDYPVFFIPSLFIPLIYNLLLAIILKLTIYKEIRDFDEFVRWMANVALFGIMLPVIIVVLFVFSFIIAFIIVSFYLAYLRG